MFLMAKHPVIYKISKIHIYTPFTVP